MNTYLLPLLCSRLKLASKVTVQVPGDCEPATDTCWIMMLDTVHCDDALNADAHRMAVKNHSIVFFIKTLIKDE